MIVRGSELDNIIHKSVDSHTAVDSMFFGIVYTEISFWGGKKKKKALLKGNIGSLTIEGNKLNGTRTLWKCLLPWKSLRIFLMNILQFLYFPALFRGAGSVLLKHSLTAQSLFTLQSVIFRILNIILQGSVHDIIRFLFWDKDLDFSDYRSYSFGCL